MTNIVRGWGAAAAFLHRQRGRRAVQSLELALLITGKNQRVFRWRAIETDNVFPFFREPWIIGKLEGFAKGGA